MLRRETGWTGGINDENVAACDVCTFLVVVILRAVNVVHGLKFNCLTAAGVWIMGINGWEVTTKARGSGYTSADDRFALSDEIGSTEV